MAGSSDGTGVGTATGGGEQGPWYYGILRDAGGYRIVASGTDPKKIDREIAHHAMPTMVVTRDDLAGLCIGDTEIARFLPPK